MDNMGILVTVYLSSNEALGELYKLDDLNRLKNLISKVEKKERNYNMAEIVTKTTATFDNAAIIEACRQSLELQGKVVKSIRLTADVHKSSSGYGWAEVDTRTEIVKVIAELEN